MAEEAKPENTEENTEQQAQADEADAVKKKPEGGGGNSLNPKLVLIVLGVNTVLVLALVATLMIFFKKKSAEQPTLGDIAAEKDDAHGGGEHGKKDEHGKEGKKEEAAPDNFIKENFTVNLADSQGAHFAQVEINIEVDEAFAKEEVNKIRPKIRDFIVVVLSSKTFEQVESNDGKDFLREEIRNKINSFLTRGQIKNVYFTQFIVQ